MEEAIIAILNYNGKDILAKYLPNIIQNSHYPIVVIDNGSLDDSIKFLNVNYPSINIILLDRNYGYSQGYNTGLKKIQGNYRYYFLLNSDVQVTPGWDKEMVKFMIDHPGTAAAQPKIRSLSKEGYFDYSGAGGGFLDQLGYPYCRGRILHTIEKDQGQYDFHREIDWASGACFCADAGLFHQFSGFNPHFFAHMEEIELCWRWRNEGYQIRFNDRVTVFHFGGGTLSQTNPFKTYLNFRNSLFMLESNLSFPAFLKIIWKRLVLDFAALVHIAFTKGFAHSGAILKAYWHYLRDRKKIINSKSDNENIRSTGPQNVYSIIWEYYFKGKRKFSDLT